MIVRKLHNLFHPIVGEIWMLHRVVEQRNERPEQRALEVTPAWLEQKIMEYRQKKYTFIPIGSIPNFCFPFFKSRRWVCLTFDDGYQDTYTLAYPLMKRLGVPFTVYVATGFVDNCQPMWWYPGKRLGIGTEELKKLDADPLCTIGAHTESHPKLGTLNHEQQYREIAGSKASLEELLGHSVNHFSFPHGSYNSNTLDICCELGFSTIVQSWGGPLRSSPHPWVLPRIDFVQP